MNFNLFGFVGLFVGLFTAVLSYGVHERLLDHSRDANICHDHPQDCQFLLNLDKRNGVKESDSELMKKYLDFNRLENMKRSFEFVPLKKSNSEVMTSLKNAEIGRNDIESLEEVLKTLSDLLGEDGEFEAEDGIAKKSGEDKGFADVINSLVGVYLNDLGFNLKKETEVSGNSQKMHHGSE